MKTVLKLLLLLAATSYMIYSFIHSHNMENDVVCSKVEVKFTDSITDGFISAQEVERILKKGGVYPIDKRLDSVQGKKIVECLLKNKYVKHAACYKNPKGVIEIELKQRTPIMRIMPEMGDDYYIDREGFKLPANEYLAHVVVASGHVTPDFAQKELPPLGLFIEENSFWKDQISQIYVTKSGKIDLYMRVGEDQVVHFGNTDSIDRKFKHLRAFYEKVLPEAGWNTYSEISVAYDNQIIGTRR